MNLRLECDAGRHILARTHTISRRRHRLVVICLAMLVIAGVTTAIASTLTYTAANCTGFTLGGVPPNQTLNCVGGVGEGNTASLTLVDKNCTSFSLNGVAPNQVLVCNNVAGSAPTLVSVASRKVHGAAGTFNLPLSP